MEVSIKKSSDPPSRPPGEEIPESVESILVLHQHEGTHFPVLPLFFEPRRLEGDAVDITSCSFDDLWRYLHQILARRVRGESVHEEIKKIEKERNDLFDLLESFASAFREWADTVRNRSFELINIFLDARKQIIESLRGRVFSEEMIAGIAAEFKNHELLRFILRRSEDWHPILDEYDGIEREREKLNILYKTLESRIGLLSEYLTRLTHQAAA